MKKTKIPGTNMAKLIINIDGRIIEKERPISDFIHEDIKVKQVDPPCKCVPSTPSIDPEIVFPYAMSLASDNYMDFIKIGVVNDFDNHSRGLYQTLDDGTVKPFNDIAIIGDSYGPIGMFIPFNANTQTLREVADMFTDVYNSRCKSIDDSHNDGFNIWE